MSGRFCVIVVAATLWLHGSVGVAAEQLLVYTVNYPLQYFAQRIAGDHAEVVLPLPPDIDPAFWQPDAAAIGAFQRADLILLNGAGYAKWTERVSLPRRKLVNTSESFRDRYIETESGVTHSHGREGDHSHAGTAFTTWLDFTQAAEQAGAVRDALSRLVPDHADTFAANFRELERDLLALDRQLLELVSRAPATPLVASHPVYQYFARRYSLNLTSMMWEPDTVAPDTEWRRLNELLPKHPAAWMLWEGEPGAENRARLQELRIQSAVFAPCANRPGEGDFLAVMSSNLENMKRVFGQEADNR